jgi:hypothetical protein
MNCYAPLTIAMTVALVSCESMTGPLSGGDFDPLAPPGSNRTIAVASNNGFTQGQFVRAAMNDTAFFLKRPSGDAEANKLLKLDTQVKVISNEGAYAKVELDSGEVGFIPAVMLTDPNAPPAGLPGAPGEVQVYPPLTPVSPTDNTLPAVPPSEVPPGGSIPAVIDPTAPPVPTPGAALGTPVPPPAPEPAKQGEPKAEDSKKTEEPKPAGN